MATATLQKKSDAFPKKRGAPQIIWMLKRHGPLTIWQLVDKIKNKTGLAPGWGTVQKSLLLLRGKDQAYVVNWTVEEKRRKKTKEIPYWYTVAERKQYEKKNGAGAPLGGTEQVEVWAVANADNDTTNITTAD